MHTCVQSVAYHVLSIKSTTDSRIAVVCLATTLSDKTAALLVQVRLMPHTLPAGLAPARVQHQSPAAVTMLDVQLANLKPTSLQQQQQQQPASCTSTELRGFDDPQIAFSAKSTQQLLQSLAIFKACSVKPLVQNADTLLAAANRLLGSTIVTSVIRHTLYNQFCGGEGLSKCDH